MLEKDKKYIKDIIESVLKSQKKMYGGKTDMNKIIQDIINKNGRKILKYKQNGGNVKKIVKDIINKNKRQCGGKTVGGRRCMNSCKIGQYCYLHCY